MKKINSLHKLGRTKSHREALLANLATELFIHKRLKTTEAKAKAMRSYVEKMITKAKKGSHNLQREVFRSIKNKEVIKVLFEEVAKETMERNGGYTRIIKLAPRYGDAAKMAFIELVDFFKVEQAEKKQKRQDRSKRVRGSKKAEKTAGDDKKTEIINSPKDDVPVPSESAPPETAQSAEPTANT